MKKVLGLDIGVSSVGFALVELSEIAENNAIICMGSRIVNEESTFHGNFYEGKTASKNADRRMKRGARRNNQRFKQRRDQLCRLLSEQGMMPDEDMLLHISGVELYGLRSKALNEKLSLKELGRVFLLLNQRRGFKSNRKSQSEEERKNDYLAKVAANKAAVQDSSIGSYLHKALLQKPNEPIRDKVFPREEYVREFDLIWKKQREFYPQILTGSPDLGKKQNKGSLYKDIKERIIYFQRPLKSQKDLISKCRFEPDKRVAPKSSPLYQWFRIWQQINNLQVTTKDGKTHTPTDDDRREIFNALHDPTWLNARKQLAKTKILKLLGFKSGVLKYEQLEGNKTYLNLLNALTEAGISNAKELLFFDPYVVEEKGGLFQLWHITYSIDNDADLIKALKKHLGFTDKQATIIAKKVGYTPDFGNVSTRAIRKMLPHLQAGKMYSDACDAAGYQHTDDPNLHPNRELADFLPLVQANSLRNPVVEQILNQLVNVVNAIIEQYGKPHEIRVELARELKMSAKQRQNIDKSNRDQRKKNEKIAALLIKEGYKRANARDIKRYRLWQETKECCLYCNKKIKFADVKSGMAEIEHILPKSRSFSNAYGNFILAHKQCNKDKDQQTAFDFMKSKGEAAFATYSKAVEKLMRKKKISKGKYHKLLCAGEDIPDDFVDRQMKDTQYISRECVKMLKTVCPKVLTTTGSVTAFLREEWELNHLLREVNKEKYRRIEKTEWKTIKDKEGKPKEVEVIKDWTKRDDNRHHAVDALICALTDQKVIFRLNNLNKLYRGGLEELSPKARKSLEEYVKKKLGIEQLNLQTYAQLRNFKYPCPIPQIRVKAKTHLERILISFKKQGSKALSKSINKTKKGQRQITWAPRGSLHEDTIFGKIKWYDKVKLDTKFKGWNEIVDEYLKSIIMERLAHYHNKPKKAFSAAEMRKNPIIYKGKTITHVTVWKEHYVKTVKLNDGITSPQLMKIVDKGIKKRLQQRLQRIDPTVDIISDKKSKVAGTTIKAAFKNVAENPIYLDDAQSIPIKSVRVFDEGKLEAVRFVTE